MKNVDLTKDKSRSASGSERQERWTPFAHGSPPCPTKTSMEITADSSRISFMRALDTKSSMASNLSITPSLTIGFPNGSYLVCGHEDTKKESQHLQRKKGKKRHSDLFHQLSLSPLILRNSTGCKRESPVVLVVLVVS